MKPSATRQIITITPRVSHGFVHNGRVRLHFVAAGEGKPILFLHGFPEFWHAWKAPLLDLARDHLAVAPDLRGYNLSDKPRGRDEYRLPVLLSDVAALLDRIAPGQSAVLVGHDWGGFLAWQFAELYPERLDRLVILNAPHPALFTRTLLRHPSQLAASHYLLWFQIPGIAERLLRAKDFALLRRVVFDGANSPDAFSPSERAAYLKAWSRPGAFTGGLNYYRAIEITSAKARARRKIQVPTLVIWGEQDASLTPFNLDGLGEVVDDLEVLRLPKATHWIVHEEPELVASEIRRFISERRRSQ